MRFIGIKCLVKKIVKGGGWLLVENIESDGLWVLKKESY